MVLIRRSALWPTLLVTCLWASGCGEPEATPTSPSTSTASASAPSSSAAAATDTGTPPGKRSPRVPQPQPAPLAVPGIAFISSNPAPGGSTYITDGSGLGDATLTFSVRFGTPIPDAALLVELFDEAGQSCFLGLVEHAIPADRPETITVPRLGWVSRCGVFPIHLATIKATLLSFGSPLGSSPRTDYFVQSFPIGYTIDRYPPPPNGPPALPVITDLFWRTALPVGGAPPISGDPVNISCRVAESDGAAVTVKLTLAWDGFAPIVKSQAFPAGASSSSEGAVMDFGFPRQRAPIVPGFPHAVLSCEAVNSRGDATYQMTEIGTN